MCLVVLTGRAQQNGLLLPPLAAVSEDGANVNVSDRFAFWRTNAHEVAAAQMCRSLSKWSGNAITERSIYKAYQVRDFYFIFIFTF